LAVVEGAAIPVLVAVGTFLSALPWLRAFSTGATLLLLLLASILSVLITSLVIRLARQLAPVSYGASAIGLVLLLLIANGFGVVAIWHGLVQGPNRLLTETLPLGRGRDLLAGPILLTWLCGSATAELVLRARREQSGLAGVGLVLPLGCYLVAYAVTTSRPNHGVLVACLLLVTVTLIAILRHGARLAATKPASVGAALEADARPHNWRGGLMAAAVAAVVAVVLAVTLPSATGLSSKRAASLDRVAPLDTSAMLDPVDALAALRDGNPHGRPVEQLRVVTNRPSDGYLAMAILDDYDGALWSFSTTFKPTGGRIPAEAQSGRLLGYQDVRQQVTLTTRPVVPLLPALDRPVSVAGVDADADAVTGMLLPNRVLGPGSSYAVVSATPGETLAKVPIADTFNTNITESSGAATTATNPADLSLPADSTTAMVTALRFLANLTGQRPAATMAFLQAVLTSLHDHERRINPSLQAPATNSTPPATTPAAKGSKAAKGRGHKKAAPPTTTTTTTVPTSSAAAGGTSLSEVINAVTVDRSGTPEQFATLFVMVARYLGVPARLVTGFRLAGTSSGSPVAAGSYSVTNRQAWAWVEMPVSGLGWVVADPTPDAGTLVAAPPPEQAQASATTLPAPEANAVPRNDIKNTHALARPSSLHIRSHHTTPIWLRVLLIVLALVVLGLLAGPGLAALRRLLRRRSRLVEQPGGLAVGAWLELLDGLQQAGMVSGPGATTAEVASEAGNHFGAELQEPVAAVGAVADQALCSSTPPDRASAEQAWSTQRDLRRRVHRGLDQRQRARALLAVGSQPRRPLPPGPPR
jgi:hypothetical protein